MPKSPGPDQVHPKVLYELTDIIDKPLCTIFNSSFKTGTVPEGWRIGQITALKFTPNIIAIHFDLQVTS
jgi:hypothetical protein